ncbi:MAG: hypothetical protein J1E03_06920 [Acetatifactor sp.]|nr:hypothetical protein [Acetatifactor sp.]
MIAEVNSLEIRGREKKVSGRMNREYLIVRLEDETGKIIELLDWNVENMERYQKGLIANFRLNLDIGKYTNISIRDFTITE